MMRELTEMQILAGASQRALANMTAANQRLQSQVHTLTERLDAVVDLALAKDAELGEMAGRLADAEAKVVRLFCLLKQARGQRDAAMALVNVTRQSRGRLIWAFKRMKQAAKHWSEAHSRELARVAK